MKTWLKVAQAVGELLSNKPIGGLVAEYAVGTRESLAYEFALLACQRTQQLLDLGRGNVVGDIESSGNKSYANLQIIRKLYHEINGGPHLNVHNFSRVELQALIAMVMHTGACMEYSALSYCYLKNIPYVNGFYKSIERCVFTNTGEDGVKHTHAFIRIDVSEPNSKNPNYIIVDPWAAFIGNSVRADGQLLINNQSAVVVYEKGIKLDDRISRNIFNIQVADASLGGGLEHLLNYERRQFTPHSVAAQKASDRCIYQMPLLPAPLSAELPNPAVVDVSTASATASLVFPSAAASHTNMAKMFADSTVASHNVPDVRHNVDDSKGMSAYEHAAQAAAPKPDTATTTMSASAPKNASATVSAAAEPPAAQPAGDSNTQAASPATPSMGSGPS